MQDRPICSKCFEVIEHSPVFEAACGHGRCPSLVWHGLCLMEYRDQRAAGSIFEVVGMMVRPWTQEHS